MNNKIETGVKCTQYTVLETSEMGHIIDSCTFKNIFLKSVEERERERENESERESELLFWGDSEITFDSIRLISMDSISPCTTNTYTSHWKFWKCSLRSQ